jgi:hypothetical protein
MKKLGILVVLLAAGLVVASGAFAQEIKFSGYVNSGLGVVFSTEENAQDPYIAAHGVDSWNNGFTIRVDGAYDNEAGNAGAFVRLQAAGGTNDVTIPIAYGWFSAFDKILTVKGGIVDDATWHTGGMYFAPDQSEGLGALVKVTPIGGLDIGAGAYVAEVPPGRGYINPGNGARELTDAKYTFNFAYTLTDMVKITATYRPKANLAVLGTTDVTAVTSRAQASVALLAVPSLTALVELELDNLQDFKALKVSDTDAWDRLVTLTTDASGKINIAEKFQYDLDSLSVGLWGVQWLSQAEDVDFSLYVNPWVSYTIGSIVPRLDIGYGNGVQSGFNNGTERAGWRRGNVSPKYDSDYSIISIRPSVKLNIDPNTFVEIGDLIDVDGGPENTWTDANSRISNVFYVDFKWSF